MLHSEVEERLLTFVITSGVGPENVTSTLGFCYYIGHSCVE